MYIIWFVASIYCAVPCIMYYDFMRACYTAALLNKMMHRHANNIRPQEYIINILYSCLCTRETPQKSRPDCNNAISQSRALITSCASPVCIHYWPLSASGGDRDNSMCPRESRKKYSENRLRRVLYTVRYRMCILYYIRRYADIPYTDNSVSRITTYYYVVRAYIRRRKQNAKTHKEHKSH